MRLAIPEIEISGWDPFANDKLGDRKLFAESLTNLIKNIDGAATIALNANWGDGKTTFLRMWQQYLALGGQIFETEEDYNNEKTNIIKKHCIYIDAFKQDYIDDPFLLISAEILEFIKNHPEIFSKEDADTIKESIAKTKVFLPIISKAITGLVPGGNLASIGIDILEKLLSAKEEKKNEQIELSNNLSTCAEKINEESSFPLVIIIDELDRCRPDYAIRMLERIKHFFDIDNIVFIISINQKQICSAIKGFYGVDTNAEEYLEK